MNLHVSTPLTAVALLLPLCAVATDPVRLQVSEVGPARFEKRGEVFFADFGQDAYANLKIEFPADPPAAGLKVRLGEKLGAEGAIDRKPPGSVNFREVSLAVGLGKRTYKLVIPSKPFHTRGQAVQMPSEIAEVTPFRYVEIEGTPATLDK